MDKRVGNALLALSAAVPHMRTAVVPRAGHALVGFADRIGAFPAEALAGDGSVP